MVLPLEAIQYNPSLDQQQPGDSLSSGAGAGFTLPGAPTELHTGLGQNFALPIQANAQILQAPPGASIARAPVAGQRFTQALGGAGEAYGSAQAVQQAQRDVATATGIPQEPLSFGQRLAIGLSPQLSQFYLKRAELQRKQAAYAQIQDLNITFNRDIREGKYDKAQSDVSRASRSLYLAPELGPQIDNYNKRLVDTRIVGDGRKALGKLYAGIVEKHPGASPDIILMAQLLNDKEVPDEAFTPFFKEMATHGLTSLSRDELRAFPELRKYITRRAGIGETTEETVTTGFSTGQLSDKQREAASLLGMSFDQLEAAVRNGIIEPGKLVQILTEKGMSIEEARTLFEAAPLTAPSGTISGATPLPRAQETARTGLAEQRREVTQAETKGTQLGLQESEPTSLYLKGKKLHDPQTGMPVPQMEELPFSQVKGRGFIQLDPGPSQQVTGLAEGSDRLTLLERLYAAPDPTTNIAEFLGEELANRVQAIAGRYFPAPLTGKGLSAQEAARGLVQGFVDDEFFSKQGDAYKTVRQILDAPFLSNKEAAQSAIQVLRGAAQRQIGRLLGQGQPLSQLTTEPGTRTSQPSGIQFSSAQRDAQKVAVNARVDDILATDTTVRQSQWPVTPALMQAVIQAESNYDPNAVSPKGAQGLTQLMPATARQLGVTNSLDIDQNIRGGVTYLQSLMDKYQGDLNKALAAYNAGPEAVDRYNGVPPYRETIDYVNKIRARLALEPLPQTKESSEKQTKPGITFKRVR